jgi:hypothetical protein
MNFDDPKLTAFALDELDEPARSTIGREVAGSPQAQRYVNETRELARVLKNQFARQTKVESARCADRPLQCGVPPTVNLSDIRDDPWFWSIGRPLAIAAAVALLAIVGGIILGNYKSGHKMVSSNPRTGTEIEAEETPKLAPGISGPNEIPNPVRRDVIQHVERVVIGELDANAHLGNGELRLIEVVNDSYRIERLKERLRIPIVSKKPYGGIAAPGYELIFLDGAGRVVASAHFYRASDSRFVLQPRKNAYERNGRYFIGGHAVLPGNWQSGIEYNDYVIDFPDWNESIGYTPGA